MHVKGLLFPPPLRGGLRWGLPKRIRELGVFLRREENLKEV